MSNNILSAFAIVTVIGFSAALLPRLVAPSDSYISEALEPTEEPFYFTLNPLSQTIVLGNPTFLSAQTNLSDVTYTWEYTNLQRINAGRGWTNSSSGTSFDGGFYIVNTSSDSSGRLVFYRCVATSGDRTIYSSPAMINVIISSNSSSNSSLSKSDFEQLEKDAEFEESEQVEVLEENERSVENAE